MLHLLFCTDGSLDVCIDSWPGRSKVCMLASIRAVKQPWQCLALVSCSQGPKRSRKFLRYTDSHLDRRDEGEEGKVREQCQGLRSISCICSGCARECMCCTRFRFRLALKSEARCLWVLYWQGACSADGVAPHPPCAVIEFLNV